MLWFGGPADQ